MELICDWISFTVPVPTNRDGVTLRWLDPTNRHLVRRQALAYVSTQIGAKTMRTLFPDIDPSTGTGRFPYRYDIIDQETAVHVFFDPNIDNILVEISGRGCRALESAGSVESLIASVNSRVTRLDLSADIECKETPVQFVKSGYSARFTSTSVHSSDSGQTVYVGSPKSDRQAAVYRYSDPHPRAHLLRVEHRLRREQAKVFAGLVGEVGLASAVISAGAIFGWESPLWNPNEIAAVRRPSIGVDAKDSNVANWLLKQVFPAMRRYEREGKIDDLRGFVNLYLFDDDV